MAEAAVKHIDGRHRILEILDRVRERVEKGEVASFAYALAQNDGAVSYGYELQTKNGDRHLLCSAIAVLQYRYMTGYDHTGEEVR